MSRVVLGKRTRREPPRKVGRTLAGRVRELEKDVSRVKLWNGGAAEFRFSALQTMFSFAQATAVVGSGPCALRMTELAMGDDEMNREGFNVLVKRITGDIELIWLGLLPGVNENLYVPRQRLQVRMMIVQVFDETEEDASVNGLAPTLVDILGNTTTATPALGTFPADDVHGATHALNGGYRTNYMRTLVDGGAADRARLRQREFKVWFDKKVNLDWKHEVYALDSRADTSAASAATYVWEGGVRRTSTNTDVGAERAERFVAKKMIVHINLPMNTRVDFVEATTQTAAEVKGNIYLYVFSDHGGTLGQSQTAANWPSTNGAANGACTWIPQCVWRYRFRMHFAAE